MFFDAPISFLTFIRPLLLELSDTTNRVPDIER